MANKLKFKNKRKQYQCVECYDIITFTPIGESGEFNHRCKKCKRDTLFVIIDEGDA
jgi:Zn finger protein HypA/HybF involved in hydrogenase expression